MRVLLDECAPKALKVFLATHGHECMTVQGAGWSGKQNGELLDLAESRFDVLVTLDTNLRYQQSLAKRKIAVVVIRARSNRLEHLAPLFAACIKAIETVQPSGLLLIE